MGRYDEVMNLPKEDRTHFAIVRLDGLPPPAYVDCRNVGHIL